MGFFFFEKMKHLSQLLEKCLQKYKPMASNILVGMPLCSAQLAESYMDPSSFTEKFSDWR
jgi:hypothetical protein